MSNPYTTALRAVTENEKLTVGQFKKCRGCSDVKAWVTSEGLCERCDLEVYGVLAQKLIKKPAWMGS